MKTFNNTITDFLLNIVMLLYLIMLLYIITFFSLRDFSILRAPPCGGNKPLLATFRYVNNYESKYSPSLEAAKFSYFAKKEFSLFLIYKPLEIIELVCFNYKYYSLSSIQIAEIKSKSNWYRAEYKEMRIYDMFDESKA